MQNQFEKCNIANVFLDVDIEQVTKQQIKQKIKTKIRGVNIWTEILVEMVRMKIYYGHTERSKQSIKERNVLIAQYQKYIVVSTPRRDWAL